MMFLNSYSQLHVKTLQNFCGSGALDTEELWGLSLSGWDMCTAEVTEGSKEGRNASKGGKKRIIDERRQ